MESYLQKRHEPSATSPRALALAVERAKQLRERGLEAAILERSEKISIRYRPLTEAEMHLARSS